MRLLIVCWIPIFASAPAYCDHKCDATRAGSNLRIGRVDPKALSESQSVYLEHSDSNDINSVVEAQMAAEDLEYLSLPPETRSKHSIAATKGLMAICMVPLCGAIHASSDYQNDTALWFGIGFFTYAIFKLFWQGLSDEPPVYKGPLSLTSSGNEPELRALSAILGHSDFALIQHKGSMESFKSRLSKTPGFVRFLSEKEGKARIADNREKWRYLLASHNSSTRSKLFLDYFSGEFEAGNYSYSRIEHKDDYRLPEPNEAAELAIINFYYSDAFSDATPPLFYVTDNSSKEVVAFILLAPDGNNAGEFSSEVIWKSDAYHATNI